MSLKSTTIKVCSTCRRHLPVSEFNANPTTHDGLRTQCKSCTKKTQDNYFLKNKDKIRKTKNDYQRGKGLTKKYRDGVREENRKFLESELGIVWKCCNCGFDSYPEALDFHHVDSSEKEYSVGKLMQKREKELLVREVVKCVLLCSNCHRHLHFE